MFKRNNLVLYVLASIVGASVDLAVHVDRNLNVVSGPVPVSIAALVVMSFAAYLLLSFLLAALFSIIPIIRKLRNKPIIVVALAIGVPRVFHLIRERFEITPIAEAAFLILLAVLIPAGLVWVIRLSRNKKTAVVSAVILTCVIVVTLALLNLPWFIETDTVEKPNVLLITVDTVRADHISLYGYDEALQPNITDLGERGVVVPYATCEVPITAPSHATMMTSLPAAAHGILLNVMYLNGDVPVLSEYFKEAGYSTSAFLGGSPLWGRHTGLDRGFDMYDDAMSPSEEFVPTTFMNGGIAAKLGFLRDDDKPLERNADEVTGSVINRLGRSVKRPYFMWVHYFDAHDEYLPPPDFAPPGLEDKRKQHDINESWSADENPPAGATDDIISLYDGEIEFVDYEIGRLLEYLEKEEALVNTVVCLVSDHGEGLLDHDTKFHGLRVYREDILIPLVFVGFGYDLPPVQINEGYPASTLDIAPTLLDLAGLTIPEQMRGRSLFSAGPDREYGYSFTVPDPKRNTPVSRGRLDALYGGDYKIIVSSRGTVELYDILNDPAETVNLADDMPEVTAGMVKALESYLGTIPSADVGPRDIDAERLETLRNLGYLR
jgi:arylsulfatase A-like enzyme